MLTGQAMLSNESFFQTVNPLFNAPREFIEVRGQRGESVRFLWKVANRVLGIGEPLQSCRDALEGRVLGVLTVAGQERENRVVDEPREVAPLRFRSADFGGRVVVGVNAFGDAVAQGNGIAHAGEKFRVVVRHVPLFRRGGVTASGGTARGELARLETLLTTERSN